MTDHLKGLLITTLGVLLVIPDSLFVRLIVADPMVISFWRAMMSGVIVLIVVLTTKGVGGFRAVAGTGWRGALYIGLIASTVPAFVLAVTNTSVANVVFIFASMPIFATAFGRVFLGEPVRARMVWTMVAVGGGLGIIAYGSGNHATASWQGDLWALYISVAYALALTILRQLKHVSMIPAIPVAFIGVALAIWVVADPMPAFQTQWPLFVGHGAFIGAATCLLAIGPRFISAAEVALLILLESVLAPVLVWAVIGEHPGSWAVLGGAVVIGALLVSNLVALRRTVRVSP
ncbi:DMT family transporter [Aliisedimentitalea scapharcae]|uniref:DMT family transporter n=1 Tax=Aliisedimentitalea scapharcae TaxID=1524259 RepID=A0ABZ2XXK9_9RHOB